MGEKEHHLQQRPSAVEANPLVFDLWHSLPSPLHTVPISETQLWPGSNYAFRKALLLWTSCSLTAQQGPRGSRSLGSCSHSRLACPKLENCLQVPFQATSRAADNPRGREVAADNPRGREAGDSREGNCFLAPSLRGDIALFSNILVKRSKALHRLLPKKRG